MAAKSPYRKLTRRSAGVAVYRSLWEGPDHLLLVTSSGYVERYQRFQYADIKTFIRVPSPRAAYWAWIWIGSAAVWVAIAGLSIYNLGSPYISGALFVFSMIGVLWNYILGPACDLYIVTRVQTLLLPVKRVRQAEKFLDRIGPVIAAAQSDLVPPAENVAAEPPNLP